MKFFTEKVHDIKGYRDNLLSLNDSLDKKTLDFFLNKTLHDSTIIEMKLLNQYDDNTSDESKKSIVSVHAKLQYWDGTIIELLWADVTQYFIDFDITRNKIAETNQILFNRGLDEWSHDELTQKDNGRLQHEIFLFSQTTIKIECKSLILNILNKK